MREDSIGLFWQDIAEPKKRGRDYVARIMPEIPDTGWHKLRDLPDLSRASVIAIDLETNDESLENDHGPGWARGVGNIAGMSVATEDAAWYFPMRHTIQPEDNYEPARILQWANVNFARRNQPKVLANASYDLGWLAQEGVTVCGDLHDVQFAEALLDSDAYVSLEALLRKYTGESKLDNIVFQWAADYYGGKADLEQRANLWRCPPKLVAPYAIGDAQGPIKVLEKQWGLLHREGLWDLYRMECRLIPLMLAMRFAGVRADLNESGRVRDVLLAKEKEFAAQLKEMAGFDVNVNAADSLKKVFDKFNLPYGRTKPSKSFPNGRPSFTKEALNKVQHPVGHLIRDARKTQKARSTFIESYILESNINGFVYPSFHQLKGDENGTVTGRLASSHPNYQNVTSRDEWLAPLIRGCYIPDEGHKQWRKYDWSQLQYRFLAHYAVGPGSDDLRRIFNTDPDADYHASVQRLIREITGIELPRKPIKNINFGFVFGMGIDKLANMLGLPLAEATTLADTYHLGVPYVKATLEACSEDARETGIVTTVLGRKTRFNLFAPANYRQSKDEDGEMLPGLPYAAALETYGHNLKRAYTHKALNYKLQGSEGDLMKLCMLRAWDEGVFAATGVPRLTVHDELDFSDRGDADDAFDYLHHEIMENSLKFKVPISVGCDVGPTWGACL
jgi:DNA polymerase-1